MITTEKVRSAVAAYVEIVGSGTSADIAALYADDATLEDPVGTAVRIGREEIRQFYSSLDAIDVRLELLTLRVVGHTAAFLFRVVTRTADETVTVEPIDVMTFNDEAQITSMRAFWSVEDVTTG